MLRCFFLLLFLGFSSSSPEIKLLVGSQFKLQCLPEHELWDPVYSWSFAPELGGDQAKKNHFSPHDHTDEYLELNPVEHNHTGTYKCVVTGLSQNGNVKMKRTFKISVIENEPLITWRLLEHTEGEPVTLPCTSSSETFSSLDSANVKWFKIKEVGNHFEGQEFNPVVRNQSPIKKEEKKNEKETPTRQFYWVSDLKKLDWSIQIDSVELEDASLYQCDISTGLLKEKQLMELVVKRAPLPRCFNYSHSWEPCPDPDSKSWEGILQESLTDFSLKLYKNVNSLDPESNLLFSPISIAMLLSHLLLGTRGETRTKLEHGLSLPNEFSCIHSEIKRLRSKTKDSILIANQIFFNEALKLHEAFVNESQEFYNSVPQKLTNDSEANVNLINSWVANQTENRIKELVDILDESTKIILLNAVYFIGKWKGTFDVINGEFATFSGDLLTVPTLYSSNFYLTTSYIKRLKAQVGKFTLTEKNSLYVLLPMSETKNGLEAMEALLTERNIIDMVRDMAPIVPSLSEVSLPKVKLLVNTDLLKLLKNLDLEELLEDPNLCGMFDQITSTPLTDARHRAFLSLTEKGVEAAAASSILFSRSFNYFNAMRPFVLIVWNEEINSPLFIGRVLHPQKNE